MSFSKIRGAIGSAHRRRESSTSSQAILLCARARTHLSLVLCARHTRTLCCLAAACVMWVISRAPPSTPVPREEREKFSMLRRGCRQPAIRGPGFTDTVLSSTIGDLFGLSMHFFGFSFVAFGKQSKPQLLVLTSTFHIATWV